jgi:hypothetical protein
MGNRTGFHSSAFSEYERPEVKLFRWFHRKQREPRVPGAGFSPEAVPSKGMEIRMLRTGQLNSVLICAVRVRKIRETPFVDQGSGITRDRGLPSGSFLRGFRL